jgi:hypothetical protein
LKALKATLFGPKLTGPMAADPPILYGDHPRRAGGTTVATVSVSDIKVANRDSDSPREPDAPSRL